MTDIPALAAALATDRYTHTALADGTGVVLDIEGMHILTLNETGEFLVAAMLAGAVDEPDLVARLVAGFEVEEPQAREDVSSFLVELSQYLA